MATYTALTPKLCTDWPVGARLRATDNSVPKVKYFCSDSTGAALAPAGAAPQEESQMKMVLLHLFVTPPGKVHVHAVFYQRAQGQ